MPPFQLVNQISYPPSIAVVSPVTASLCLTTSWPNLPGSDKPRHARLRKEERRVENRSSSTNIRQCGTSYGFRTRTWERAALGGGNPCAIRAVLILIRKAELIPPRCMSTKKEVGRVLRVSRKEARSEPHVITCMRTGPKG
jgi:hypothetical protein